LEGLGGKKRNGTQKGQNGGIALGGAQKRLRGESFKTSRLVVQVQRRPMKASFLSGLEKGGEVRKKEGGKKKMSGWLR